MLTEEIIQPSRHDGNLQDYEQARQNFDWKEIEKHFTWYETGKVNMAYEAIDRHAASDRANKIALIYSDDTR